MIRERMAAIEIGRCESTMERVDRVEPLLIKFELCSINFVLRLLNFWAVSIMLGCVSINFERCRSLWNAVDQFQASPIKFGRCESSKVRVDRLWVLSVARFGSRYIYSKNSPILAILIPASFNAVEIYFAKSKAFSPSP